MKNFEEIYSHFLNLKLKGKNATFRYSTKNKLCKECFYRIKCATDILKKCPIRESVNTNLENSRNLFNRVLGPKKDSCQMSAEKKETGW